MQACENDMPRFFLLVLSPLGDSVAFYETSCEKSDTDERLQFRTSSFIHYWRHSRQTCNSWASLADVTLVSLNANDMSVWKYVRVFKYYVCVVYDYEI
jgi:hypothetical protein